MGMIGPQGDGPGFPLTPSSSRAFCLGSAGFWASPSLSPPQASAALAAAPVQQEPQRGTSPEPRDRGWVNITVVL